MNELLREKFAEIKCVYSDIDGTIINEDHIITNETLAAVQELKNNGYEFGLITGRTHYLSDYELKALQPTMPFIGCNGSWIYDYKKQQTLSFNAFNLDFVNLFINELKKIGLSFVLFSETKIYYYIGTNSFSKNNLLQGIKKYSAHSTAKFEEFFGELRENRFIQFTVYGLKDYIHAIPQKLIDITNAYSIQTIRGEAYSFDACNCSSTKGTGLEEMAKLHNLETKNVLVIGDSYNDIPMFKIAGISVAMHQANDDVKKFAMLQTAFNNDDNGFANFVQNVLLSKK